MIIQTLALLISTGHSAIMGNDDRTDTLLTNQKYQDIAHSVAALIQKKNVIKNDDNTYSLKGTPMNELNVCSNERFAQESLIANCSASLIAPDKILTAAHCLDGKNYGCDTYMAVFDYQNDNENEVFSKKLSKNSVYSCKKIDYFEFDTVRFTVDLAVITLDRVVENRKPVKFDLGQNLKIGDELFMIGFPLGISQKVVSEGKVTSYDKKGVSYKHNLDTFSVNSGGPLFDKDSVQVGVLVRGTGPNLVEDEKANCMRWYEGNDQDFSEANDLSKIPKALLKP